MAFDHVPHIEQLFEVSRDLFCIADTGGFFLWVNPAFEHTLGWSRDELTAVPFIDFVHPDDVEATLAEVAKLSQGVPTVVFLNRYRTKDCDWRWLEWNCMPDSTGLLYASAREVTTRKVAEAKFEMRAEWLRLAERLAGVGHWHVDLVDEKLTWSDEVYRIHGLAPETFTPTLKSGIDAYHPDDRAQVEGHIARAIEEKSSFQFELRLIRRDGAVRDVRSIGRTELDTSGQVIALFGVFIDITQDAMQKRRLERQNRDLEQFAFVASHDLREPLRNVSNFADLLRAKYPKDVEDPEQAMFLDFITDGTKRMRELVDGLLQFARAGREELAVESVDLNQVVDRVQADLAILFEESGGTLSVTSPLPVVTGAQVQIEQLFLNLIGNALKFRRDIPVHVQIRADEMATHHRIFVEDNGIGIAPAHRERIFQIFRRVHPRTEFAGTGIGLSIVKRIVELHSGEVWVESELGKGSTFVFTLAKHIETGGH